MGNERSSTNAPGGDLRCWLKIGLLLLVAFTSHPARAQPSADWPLAETVSGVLFQNYQRSKLMSALGGLEWRPGISMAMARLAAGQSVSLRVHLEAGQQYAFIAGGDDRVRDLDLYVRRVGGAVVASDREPDGSPVVLFTPTREGDYILQLQLPSATASEAIVGLNLLVSDGRLLPEDAFREATLGFTLSTNALSAAHPLLDFTTVPGQWLLYGLLVGEDSPVTLEPLRLGDGEVCIAAAGSNRFQNIDLYLAKPDGGIVSGTTRDPTMPLLLHTSVAKARYRLRVRGKTAGGADLLLLGVYEK